MSRSGSGEQVLSDAYYNFIIRIPNAATRENYVCRLRKFLEYCQLDSYDQLLYNGDTKLIQTRIVDYLIHVQAAGLATSTVSSHQNTIKFFYVMNDVTTLNWRKISKVKKPPHKEGNERPYIAAEIGRLLESTDMRGRCCILLMCSSGIRQGGIHTLKLANLQRMGDIYKITVYHNDPEEYFTFCSPECAKALDQYFEYRKRCGEILKPSSPIIRQQFDKNNPEQAANPKPVGPTSIENIFYRAINDSGLREKKNVIRGEKRYLHEVMQSHGLRKFFNTQVVTSGMSALYSEMLMGHHSGLAMQSYVKPSVSQLYDEYMKVVDSVTINEENRLKKENKSLREENREIQRAMERIDDLYKRLGY
jgi:integrase